MTFKVPNTPDASYIDQSEPDAGDFAALGERSTGVLTGCAVTAQGTPALAVDTAAGTYIVAGVPYTKTSGSVTIVAGESQPRFDLIVGTSASVAVVLKGAASSNPTFPSAFDPATHCLFAAVYVRQSVSAIQVTDVVDKRVTAPNSFTRIYTNTTTSVVSTTDNNSKTMSLRSDGLLSWMSSTLGRLGDSAMQFLTSLTIKAQDTSLVNLILKGRSASPGTINVLEVQPNATTTTLAAISGTGVGVFDNFKRGTGSPEGSVVGATGDIYIDAGASDYNNALYFKIGGGNTGWKAMQQHDTTGNALPTGMIMATPASSGTSFPGYAFCGGASVSATDPTYTALYAIIQNTFGGSPGVSFLLPDYRGVGLAGVGGQLGLTLGTTSGSLTGLITVGLTNMPRHGHDVNQQPHSHPMPGFPYFWRVEPTGLRPYPAGSAPVANIPQFPYMDIWPFGFDDGAYANIQIGQTGSGTPLSALTATSGVNYFIKL